MRVPLASGVVVVVEGRRFVLVRDHVSGIVVAVQQVREVEGS